MKWSLFNSDEIPHPGVASCHFTGSELEGRTRSENHRRHPPGPKPLVYANHAGISAEEDDIDRKAHEKHVHPHKRIEARTYEKHPVARCESVSPEQPAALTGDTTRVFEPRTEYRRARMIHGLQHPQTQLSARWPICMYA
jgi:hypothetical protein